MSASNPFARKHRFLNPDMELNDVDIGRAVDEYIPLRAPSRPVAQASNTSPQGNHAAKRRVLCAEGAGVGRTSEGKNVAGRSPGFASASIDEHGVRNAMHKGVPAKDDDIIGRLDGEKAANRNPGIASALSLDGASVLRPGYPTANVNGDSKRAAKAPSFDACHLSIGDKSKKRRYPKPSRRRPKVPTPDLGEFDRLNARGIIDSALSAAEHERNGVQLRRSSRLAGEKRRRPIVVSGPSVLGPVDVQVSSPETVATTSPRTGGGPMGLHSAENLAHPLKDGTAAQGSGSRPRRSSMRIRARRRRANKSSASVIIDLTGDDDSVILEQEEVTLQDLNITAPPHNFGEIPVSTGESVPHPRLEPLKDEEEKLVAKLLRGRDSSRKMSTIPSARITLRWRDFALLRGVEWLNDEVINSYMALINDRETRFWRAVDEGRMDAEHSRPRSFCFNTFFFTRLVDGSDSGYDYGGVARWTKRAKVDITKLDYVIVPINLGNNHWILVVVNIPFKEIYYLDSMKAKDDAGVVSSLQQWVVDEIKDKSGLAIAKAFEEKDWTVLYHKYPVKRSLSGALVPHSKRFHMIPTQRTSGSCGVYAAKIADCIALGVPVYFSAKDIQLMRRRMALELYQRVLPG